MDSMTRSPVWKMARAYLYSISPVLFSTPSKETRSVMFRLKSFNSSPNMPERRLRIYMLQMLELANGTHLVGVNE